MLMRILFMTANENPQWTPETNLQAALRLKEEGNAFFAKQDFPQALKYYHKANLHLAGIISKESSIAAYSKNLASEDIGKQAQELRFSVFLNMGQIYIYQAKFEKGRDILTKAIVIRTNTKLLYRRAICLMNCKQLQEAKSDFKRAVDFEPTLSVTVQSFLTKIKQIESLQDKASQNLFKKFFS